MTPFKGVPKQTVLRPKQTAFRLPQRTLDILDKMVEEGKARTRTDALILAVDTSSNFVLTDENDIVKKVSEYDKKQIEQQREIDELKEQMNSMRELVQLHDILSREYPDLLRGVNKKKEE